MSNLKGRFLSAHNLSVSGYSHCFVSKASLRELVVAQSCPPQGNQEAERNRRGLGMNLRAQHKISISKIRKRIVLFPCGIVPMVSSLISKY